MTLPDTSRLVDESKYNKLLLEFNENELNKQKIFKISNNFRVIAIGSNPTKSNDYISNEMATLFSV